MKIRVYLTSLVLFALSLICIQTAVAAHTDESLTALFSGNQLSQFKTSLPLVVWFVLSLLVGFLGFLRIKKTKLVA